MALSLSRNAKFYVGLSGGNAVQEIGILDGFSFSQATGTQNVTLNEAGASPKRGQQIFNTTLEPVDWSFTSYVRPLNSGTADTAVEELLWNALVSETDAGGMTYADGSMEVALTDSNSNQLLELDGYFEFSDSGEVFKLTKMCVNTASIDFDIDGIAQISWSGYASGVVSGATVPTSTAVPSTADFILNRLSTVVITGQTVSAGTLALTGGNVTIDNGITYVTPETLGVINTPFTHQTGTRAITGNLTAYLDGTGKDVYDSIVTDINSAAPDVTNEFAITVNIGGATAPKVTFAIANAHLELPSIDTADVMGVTLNFTGLESTFGTSADEATITYTPGA